MDIDARARADELVDELTGDEQASLTGGRGVWHLPALERVGLAAIKMSDGPAGVRGESVGTIRSLSFPCGLAAGSTWDVELVERYGGALGDEARSKGVHVLLGPTVCLPRTPLGGRTFESFAEDPWLSSRMTVAYVRGVQSRGVASCVKHFAANDQETDRMSVSVELSDRALREVHLAPFEAAVREAGAWAVMGAYNRVGGTYCCEHERLLRTILKEEWGFDGVVVSDWTATHSTVAAASAGLDVEMPGPPTHFGAALADAVAAGDLDAAVVREQARRVLLLAARCGAIGAADPAPEREDDDPTRRATARELVVGGSVLLRNDGTLPIPTTDITRIALLGPNGIALQSGGGGSSEVMPLAPRSLATELRDRLPHVEVVAEAGVNIDRGLPPAPMELLGGSLTIDLYGRADETRSPDVSQTLYRSSYLMLGETAPGLDPSSAWVRAHGTFTADVTGSWELGVASVGPSQLFLDGVLVADNRAPVPGTRFFGLGSEVVSATVDLVAGEPHELRVEMDPSDTLITGFDLLARQPQVPDALPRAVAAAKAADIALVVVGSNPQWETEGEDRPDLRLVGEQDALVAAVAAANPRTVVVVNSGGPIEMPWVDDVAAILNVWYPGEEGAAGLVDMLVGVAEPGGRLPITFPRRIEDTAPAASPAWFPGVDGRVVYGEELFIGHRHLDAHGIDPLFPFGHGLSYTTFELGTPTVSGLARSWTVDVPVTNTGSRSGSTVVQLYVEPVDAADDRPVRHLAGFAKLTLAAGTGGAARIELGESAFRQWDVDRGAWTTPGGDYRLRVGHSSRDLPVAVPLRV
jgi:beta-glucosidase